MKLSIFQWMDRNKIDHFVTTPPLKKFWNVKKVILGSRKYGGLINNCVTTRIYHLEVFTSLGRHLLVFSRGKKTVHHKQQNKKCKQNHPILTVLFYHYSNTDVQLPFYWETGGLNKLLLFYFSFGHSADSLLQGMYTTFRRQSRTRRPVDNEWSLLTCIVLYLFICESESYTNLSLYSRIKHLLRSACWFQISVLKYQTIRLVYLDLTYLLWDYFPK
jgi:hypothetical protein